MALPEHLPSDGFELLYEVLLNDKEALRIYYATEQEAVLTRSIGFSFGRELHRFLNAIIQFLDEKQSSKLVVDLTYRNAYTEDDKYWINEEWFPRAIGVGLQTFAYVLSRDIFMRLSAEEIVRQYQDKVHLAPFGDLQEALAWVSADPSSGVLEAEK